ncbi:hypothetical protein [Marinifilum flexuosum]|uniref:hypothetical protein n=1 Tax=Marinifilum flexuosum TaxID=1117708 RepID=UPI0024918DF0|nr:hypothetical protein [Marinifilum flexuosum]
MKKVLFTTLAFILGIYAVFAQKQGTIVYENTINIHKSLGPDQQALKAMIPETTSKNFQFIFSEKHGCLKELKSDSPKGVMIQMGGSKNSTWFNFEKNVFRNYIDLDDELFHTETPIITSDAKPTGRSKNILGYKCDEYKSSDDEFSFWVAKDFPKKITPMPSLFFNGAVLAVDNDRLSFKAISFSKDIDEKELIPAESQEITAEQFQDLQEEKLSEMKAMGGKVMKMGN